MAETVCEEGVGQKLRELYHAAHMYSWAEIELERPSHSIHSGLGVSKFSPLRYRCTAILSATPDGKTNISEMRDFYSKKIISNEYANKIKDMCITYCNIFDRKVKCLAIESLTKKLKVAQLKCTCKHPELLRKNGGSKLDESGSLTDSLTTTELDPEGEITSNLFC
eukprot:Nk52_evm2s680 gene=Nk52_evmTU2s680